MAQDIQPPSKEQIDGTHKRVTKCQVEIKLAYQELLSLLSETKAEQDDKYTGNEPSTRKGSNNEKELSLSDLTQANEQHLQKQDGTQVELFIDEMIKFSDTVQNDISGVSRKNLFYPRDFIENQVHKNHISKTQ